MVTIDELLPDGYRLLFGHPVVPQERLAYLATIIDSEDLTDRIPKDLDHPSYSTSGYFPRCEGRIEKEYRVFRIKDHACVLQFIIVREDCLTARHPLSARFNRTVRDA